MATKQGKSSRYAMKKLLVPEAAWMLKQYIAAFPYARTCAVVHGSLDAAYLPVLLQQTSSPLLVSDGR